MRSNNNYSIDNNNNNNNTNNNNNKDLFVGVNVTNSDSKKSGSDMTR